MVSEGIQVTLKISYMWFRLCLLLRLEVCGVEA